jgi:hypothetical protein
VFTKRLEQRAAMVGVCRRNEARRSWENTMLRQLALCGMLAIATAVSAQAQQRHASLQRIEIPQGSFDLLVAAPKPGGLIYDLAEAPDALLLILAGGELAIGFERAEDMLKTSELVRGPACSFPGRGRTPIAIYVVPKGD